jgi:hypothetical protein
MTTHSPAVKSAAIELLKQEVLGDMKETAHVVFAEPVSRQVLNESRRQD